MRITSTSVAITAVTAGMLCCLVYLRALSCNFVNLDDPLFVIDNTHIRHLPGAKHPGGRRHGTPLTGSIPWSDT